MTIGTTTALNLLQGALRRINSYQSGEQIALPDATDCLDTLNDLLDSLSLDKQYVFGSNENILTWTAQKRLYSVGNPIMSLFGSAPFNGTLTSGSPTITDIQERTSIEEYALSAKVNPWRRRSFRIFRCEVNWR